MNRIRCKATKRRAAGIETTSFCGVYGTKDIVDSPVLVTVAAQYKFE